MPDKSGNIPLNTDTPMLATGIMKLQILSELAACSLSFSIMAACSLSSNTADSDSISLDAAAAPGPALERFRIDASMKAFYSIFGGSNSSLFCADLPLHFQLAPCWQDFSGVAEPFRKRHFMTTDKLNSATISKWSRFNLTEGQLHTHCMCIS